MKRANSNTYPLNVLRARFRRGKIVVILIQPSQKFKIALIRKIVKRIVSEFSKTLGVKRMFKKDFLNR